MKWTAHLVTKQNAYRCREGMVTAKNCEIKWYRERKPMVSQEAVGNQRRKKSYTYAY